MSDALPNLTSLAPVHNVDETPPMEGIGLCLSGGGYRAMLFHVGTVLRLNECAYLPKLNRISSVSGGSITAAVLGLHWKRLEFTDGVAANIMQEFVAPIRRFATHTIDVTSVVDGILFPGTISSKVTRAYRDYLFGDATLQALPDDPPRFVINATNIQSGALVRFSKPYLRDYKVGEIRHPTLSLAEAVAASSAFPPILSPAILKLDPDAFSPAGDEPLSERAYRERMVVSDGGVYDNLGMETVWKRYQTVLVSDAGMRFTVDPDPATGWVRHSMRVLDVIDNQVRSLRKRQLISSYKAKARLGAYWGINTDIRNYQLPDALPCPLERTAELAAVRTRLAALSDEVQERLINWGYAVSDAALRSHVDAALPAPAGFPYRRGV